MSDKMLDNIARLILGIVAFGAGFLAGRVITLIGPLAFIVIVVCALSIPAISWAAYWTGYRKL